jgi:GLPGLI family protein
MRKKLFFTLRTAGVLSFLASMGSGNLSAQKNFEGTITYSISIDGLPPEAQAMMAGAEMKIFMKKGKVRTDANMGMQQSTTIADEKAKLYVTLIDFMGSKYMIKSNMDSLKKENEKQPKPEVRELSETKEIAGYKCKKAEVTHTDKNGAKTTMNVFYTDEISNPEYGSQLKGIKGLPMEYQINQGPMVIKYTVTSVSKDAVQDSRFTVPEGYKLTTMEELQKMYGGGGQ